MFDKVKQLNELRKQSKEIEHELQEDVFEVQHKGVILRIRGDLQLQNLVTSGKSDAIVLEAINKALKEAQKEAAKKMRGRLGNLSGLLG